MNQMLIVKTGSTMDDLKARKGDFEDWILAGMGLEHKNARIIDAQAGNPLPSPQRLSGIVITGSHAMVTDHHAWSRQAAQWVKHAATFSVPILGICYGHQLIAHSLGGIVGNNPNGREFGTVDVRLNRHADKDPLFSGLPQTILIQTSHTQSVLKLPPGAVLLGSSVLDPHHAFVWEEHVWGVQFHPEFDSEITKAYIEVYRKDLRAEGKDVDALLTSCRDTPYGTALLKRFSRILKKDSSG
jgi:GMP synthase (glutamine-hydrolysing)